MHGEEAWGGEHGAWREGGQGSGVGGRCRQSEVETWCSDAFKTSSVLSVLFVRNCSHSITKRFSNCVLPSLTLTK